MYCSWAPRFTSEVWLVAPPHPRLRPRGFFVEGMWIIRIRLTSAWSDLSRGEIVNAIHKAIVGDAAVFNIQF